MLPAVWIMVLLHFQVDLSLYIILKRALQELEGPKDYCLLSKEHLELAQTSQPASIFPKDNSLGSHMVGWSIRFTWILPLWLGGHGRVHQKCRKLNLYIKYCLLCESHAHKKLVVVKLSDVHNVSIPDRIWGTSSLVTDDLAMAWPLWLIINMCRPAISCSKHLVPTESQ